MIQVGTIATERRGRNVALFGLLAQFLLTVALTALWSLNGGSEALLGALFLFATGMIMWLVLVIIYHQRKKVAVEALESQELKRDAAAGSAAIFESEEEQWLVAGRRLQWLYRWVLPLFVLIIIFELSLLGFILWRRTISVGLGTAAVWNPFTLPTLSMFFLGGVALLAFLLSRYLLGMSREPEWRMLKSCSIWLFGNALVCLIIVICLMLRKPFPMAVNIAACGIAVLYAVLAIEFLINFILDFYRPRGVGEGLRPAFESRLLGLISEPGGIARSIADAVNYQFGFDVSSTWFYRMLGESVPRIIALAIIVMGIMTSFTVVDADELAYVERYGEPIEDPATGQTKLYTPGLWFKAPWPIDQVRKTKVDLVQQIIIGEPKKKQEPMPEQTEEVITWTKEHGYVPSVDVLVATKRDPADEANSDGNGEHAVAASVLRISMPVQYRVKKDPVGFRNYMASYENPEAMLRDIAYRELVKQAVSFDYEEVMSTDRSSVADDLQRNIQTACDQFKVGVDIVFVGLQEVHPPTESDVARTFQAVATAQQEKETFIHAANIDYINALVETAGDQARAERIYASFEVKDLAASGERDAALDRITTYLDEDARKYRGLLPVQQFLVAGNDLDAAVDMLDEQIETLMLGDVGEGVTPVTGLAGEVLAQARSNALERVSAAAAKAANFKLELAAFEASPKLYRMRKRLGLLSDELDDIRKYVLMIDQDETDVIIVDVETDSGVLDAFKRSAN